MFYEPVILRRGSGSFATIWLAATRGTAISRREFLKVNVASTCNDIMSYILVQVLPPQPDLPRPRFSLYLSAQLKYGVVVVYHHQCAILLKDLESIVDQLLKHSRSKTLDLGGPGRQMMLSTDALSHLNEIDGPLDPFFGEMAEFLPSANALMQEEQSPERRASSTEHEATPTGFASSESRHTASPQDITIAEPRPAGALQPEFFDEELEPASTDTLDFLMGQNDNFLDDLLRAPEEEAKMSPGKEVEVVREREPELERDTTASTLNVDPASVSSRDRTLPTQDEPRPLADQQTPVGVSPPSLSLPTAMAQIPDSEDVPRPEETAPKRKRGRQLIFLDPHTQLSRDEMESQIQNPLTETRVRPFLPPESWRLKRAEELLSEPCGVFPEDLMLLWRQATTITPMVETEAWPQDRATESSGSKKDLGIGFDSSAREVQKDGAEQEEAHEGSGPGSFPLEAADQQEGSRNVSPIYPLEQESRTRSSSSLGGITEMPESRPLLEEEQEKTLLFTSLLPPEPDRRTVSVLFQKLIVTLATGRLTAEQAEPCGEIVIRPGPNYDADLPF
ncbi:meiotic recombination protein REC8 homolog [Syngnathus typhle]|uniref:meiotic recombination protein REC8 homolog n=1 Tax=Syngnathus typhle TaxID=161592 RepID=UPI002A6B5706|nr:meiotic recombination protein REC8 homolog [Syngnathus typhle]